MPFSKGFLLSGTMSFQHFEVLPQAVHYCRGLSCGRFLPSIGVQLAHPWVVDPKALGRSYWWTTTSIGVEHASSYKNLVVPSLHLNYKVRIQYARWWSLVSRVISQGIHSTYPLASGGGGHFSNGAIFVQCPSLSPYRGKRRGKEKHKRRGRKSPYRSP